MASAAVAGVLLLVGAGRRAGEVVRVRVTIHGRCCCFEADFSAEYSIVIVLGLLNSGRCGLRCALVATPSRTKVGKWRKRTATGSLVGELEHHYIAPFPGDCPRCQSRRDFRPIPQDTTEEVVFDRRSHEGVPEVRQVPNTAWWCLASRPSSAKAMTIPRLSSRSGAFALVSAGWLAENFKSSTAGSDVWPRPRSEEHD